MRFKASQYFSRLKAWILKSRTNTIVTVIAVLLVVAGSAGAAFAASQQSSAVKNNGIDENTVQSKDAQAKNTEVKPKEEDKPADNSHQTNEDTAAIQSSSQTESKANATPATTQSASTFDISLSTSQVVYAAGNSSQNPSITASTSDGRSARWEISGGPFTWDDPFKSRPTQTFRFVSTSNFPGHQFSFA